MSRRLTRPQSAPRSGRRPSGDVPVPSWVAASVETDQLVPLSAATQPQHRSLRGGRLTAAAIAEGASRVTTHPLASAFFMANQDKDSVASSRSKVTSRSLRRPQSANAASRARESASAHSTPHAPLSLSDGRTPSSIRAHDVEDSAASPAVVEAGNSPGASFVDESALQDLADAVGNTSVASWNSRPHDAAPQGQTIDESVASQSDVGGPLCDWEVEDLRKAAAAMAGDAHNDRRAHSTRPASRVSAAGTATVRSRMSARETLAAAAETFRLDGVDVESFQEFLAYLRGYQDDCEQRGLYEEAHMAQQRIAQTRDEFARFTAAVLAQRHAAERESVEEAHREALEAFHADWAQKRAVFEHRAADMLAALRHRQDEELARFDNHHAEFRPKASKQTQELMRAEFTAARLGQYATAADVQRERLRLEWDDLQSRWRERQKSVDKRRELLVAKQDADARALEDRIDRLRMLGLRNMENELQRIESRARALRRQLEVSQAHENTELGKTIRMVAAAPLATAHPSAASVGPSTVGLPLG